MMSQFSPSTHNVHNAHISTNTTSKSKALKGDAPATPSLPISTSSKQSNVPKSKVLQQLALLRQQQMHLYQQLNAIRPSLNHDLELLFSIGCSRGERSIGSMQMSRASFAYFLEQFGVTTLTPYHEFERKSTIHLRDRELRQLEVEAILATEEGYEDPTITATNHDSGGVSNINSARAISIEINKSRSEGIVMNSPTTHRSASLSPSRLMSPVGMSGLGSLQTTARGKSREREASTARTSNTNNNKANSSKKLSRANAAGALGLTLNNTSPPASPHHQENTYTIQLLRIAEDSVDALFDYGLGFATEYQNAADAMTSDKDEADGNNEKKTNEPNEASTGKISSLTTLTSTRTKQPSVLAVPATAASQEAASTRTTAEGKSLRVDQFVLLCIDIAKRMVPVDDYPPISNISLHLDLMQQLFLGPFAAEFKQMMMPGRTLNEFNIPPSAKELIQGPVLDTLAHAYASVTNAAMITINGNGENTTSGAVMAGGPTTSYATAGLASSGEDEVDDVMRADFFIQMFTGDIPLEYEAIIALLQHVGISTAQLGGDFLYKLFQRYDTKLYESRTTIDFHGFVLLLLHVCVIRYGTDQYKLELTTVASRFQRLIKDHFLKQFPIDDRLYYISKAEDLARVVKPMSIIHTLNARGRPAVVLDGLRPAVATRGAQLWVFGNNFPVKNVSHGKKCPLYVRFGSSPVDPSSRVLDGGLVFARGSCSSATMGSVAMPHINPTADTRTDLIVQQTEKKHTDLDEGLNENGEPKENEGDTEVKITGGKRDDYAKEEEKFNYSVLLETTTTTPVFISVDRLTWTLRDDVVIDYKDTLLKLRLSTELVRKLRQVFTSFGLRGPDYEEEGELRVGKPYVGLQQWVAICQNFPIAGVIEDGDLDTMFHRHPIFFEIAKPRSDYIDLNAPVLDFNDFIKVVFRYFNAVHGVTTRLADFISTAFEKAATISQAYRKEYYKKKFAFWTPSQGRDFTEKIINSDAVIDNSRSDAFLTNIQTGSIAAVAEAILKPSGDDAIDKVSCVNCGCNPQIKDGNPVLEIEWNGSSLGGPNANAPPPKGYEHALLATKDFSSATDHRLGGKPPQPQVPRTASSVKNTGRIKGGANNNASFKSTRGQSRERNNETIATAGGGDLLQSSFASSRGPTVGGNNNNTQLTNESFFGELARESSLIMDASHTEASNKENTGMSPRVKAAVNSAIKVLQKKRKLKPLASSADQLPIEDGQLQSYIFKTLATIMETMPADDISDEIDADTYAGMTFEKGMALPPRGQMCFISSLLDRFLTLHNEVVAEGEAYFQKSTAKARAAGRFLSLQLFTLQRSMEAIAGCMERLEGLINDAQHTAQEERRARLSGEIRNSDTLWAMEQHLLAGIKRSMTFIGDLTRPYIDEDAAIDMSLQETMDRTDNFLKEIKEKALELDSALRSRVVAAKEGPASEKIAGLKVGNELRAAIAEANDFSGAVNASGDIKGAESSLTGLAGGNNSANSFTSVVNTMSTVTQAFASGRGKVDARALELQKRELTDDFERKMDDLKLSLTNAFEEQKSEYETKAFVKNREVTNLLHQLLKHAQEEINIPKDLANPCFKLLSENGISLRKVTHGASGRKEEDNSFFGGGGDIAEPKDVATQACEEDLPAVQEMQQWLTLRGVKNAQRLAVCGTVLRQSFLIGKRSLTKYATNPTMFDDFSKMIKSEMQYTMNARHSERISLPKQSELLMADATTGTLLTMKEFVDAERYAGYELKLEALEKLIELTEDQSKARNAMAATVKTAVANQKSAVNSIMEKVATGKGGAAVKGAGGKGNTTGAAALAAKQKEKEEAAAHKQLMNQAATHYVSPLGVLLPIPPSMLVGHTAKPSPQNFVATQGVVSSPISNNTTIAPSNVGGIGVETQFDRDIQFALLQQRMVRRAARMDSTLIEKMYSLENRCKFAQTLQSVVGPTKETTVQTDAKEEVVPIPTQTDLTGSDYDKLKEQLERNAHNDRILSAASTSERSDEDEDDDSAEQDNDDPTSFFLTNDRNSTRKSGDTKAANKFSVLPGFVAGGGLNKKSASDSHSNSQSLSAKGTTKDDNFTPKGKPQGPAKAVTSSKAVTSVSQRSSSNQTTPLPITNETDRRAALEDERRAKAGLPPRRSSAGTPQLMAIPEARVRSVRSTPQSSSLRKGINSGDGREGLLTPSDIPSTASSFAQQQAEKAKQRALQANERKEGRQLAKSSTTIAYKGERSLSSESGSFSESSATTSTDTNSEYSHRNYAHERGHHHHHHQSRPKIRSEGKPHKERKVRNAVENAMQSYSSADNSSSSFSSEENEEGHTSRMTSGGRNTPIQNSGHLQPHDAKRVVKDRLNKREKHKHSSRRHEPHTLLENTDKVAEGMVDDQNFPDESPSAIESSAMSSESEFSITNEATETAEKHSAVAEIYDGTSAKQAQKVFEKVEKRNKYGSSKGAKHRTARETKKQAKNDHEARHAFGDGALVGQNKEGAEAWQSLPLGIVRDGDVGDGSFSSPDSFNSNTESYTSSESSSVVHQSDHAESKLDHELKGLNPWHSRRNNKKAQHRKLKPFQVRQQSNIDELGPDIEPYDSSSNNSDASQTAYTDSGSEEESNVVAVNASADVKACKVVKLIKKIVPVKKVVKIKRHKVVTPAPVEGEQLIEDQFEEFEEEVEELQEIEVEVTDTEVEGVAMPLPKKERSQNRKKVHRQRKIKERPERLQDPLSQHSPSEQLSQIDSDSEKQHDVDNDRRKGHQRHHTRQKEYSEKPHRSRSDTRHNAKESEYRMSGDEQLNKDEEEGKHRRRRMETDEERAERRQRRRAQRKADELNNAETKHESINKAREAVTPTSKSRTRLSLALSNAHQANCQANDDVTIFDEVPKHSPKSGRGSKSRNLAASTSDLSSSLKPIIVVDIPSTYQYFNETVLDEREEHEDIVLPHRNKKSGGQASSSSRPYVTVSVKSQTITRRFTVISKSNPLPAYTATKTHPVTYISPSLPEPVKHYLLESQKNIKAFELESIRNSVAYNEWLAKNNVHVDLDKELANAKLSQDELRNAVLEARRGSSRAKSVEVSHRKVVNSEANSVALYKGYGGNANLNGGSIEIRSFGRSLADSADPKNISGHPERTPLVKLLGEDRLEDLNTSLPDCGDTSPKGGQSGRRKSSSNSIKAGGYRLGLLKKSDSSLTPKELEALSGRRRTTTDAAVDVSSPTDLIIQNDTDKGRMSLLKDREDVLMLRRSEYEALKARSSDASVIIAERDLVRSHIEVLLKRFGSVAVYQKFKLDTNGAGLYEIAELLETELRRAHHERSLEAQIKAETLRKGADIPPTAANEGAESESLLSTEREEVKTSSRKSRRRTDTKHSPLPGIDWKAYEALKGDCIMLWVRHFGERARNASLSQRKVNQIMTDYGACARSLAMQLLGDSLQIQQEPNSAKAPTSTEGADEETVEAESKPAPLSTVTAELSLTLVEDVLNKVRKGFLTDGKLKALSALLRSKEQGNLQRDEATVEARDTADAQAAEALAPKQHLPSGPEQASLSQPMVEVNYLVNSMFALLDDRLGDPPASVTKSQSTLNVWRQHVITTLLARIRQTTTATDSRMFSVENGPTQEMLEVAERWAGVHEDQKAAIDRLVSFPILNPEQQRLVSFFQIRACGYILHALATDNRRYVAIARAMDAAPEHLHSESAAKHFVITNLFANEISQKMLERETSKVPQSWLVTSITVKDIPADWPWRLSTFNSAEYVALDTWARDNGYIADGRDESVIQSIDTVQRDHARALQRYQLLRETYLMASNQKFGPLGTLSPLQWLARAKACMRIWARNTTEAVQGASHTESNRTPQRHPTLPSLASKTAHSPVHLASPSAASPLGKCPVAWLQQQPLPSTRHMYYQTGHRSSLATSPSGAASGAFSMMMQRRLLQLTPPPRDPPQLPGSVSAATPQPKLSTEPSATVPPQASMLHDSSRFLLQLFPAHDVASQQIPSLDEHETHELELLREKCLAPWASTNVASTTCRKWLALELRQAASVLRQTFNTESGAHLHMQFSQKVALLLQKVLKDKQPSALQRWQATGAATPLDNTALVDTLLSLSRGQIRQLVNLLSEAKVKDGSVMAVNPAAQSPLPTLRFK